MNIIDVTEAKKYICPFRVKTVNSRCAGSGCMAWKWKISEQHKNKPFQSIVSNTHGYCSLIK